ncbi:MAG: Chemotaxis protein CheA [Promethearchaeota archaeon]|nr:MAG: Chemotaxis protein CheA [Candidatus Lokiarchaeota archaeon]
MSSKENKDMELFIKEAEDIIEEIEESILNLEEDFKNNDPVERLYFSFHNLKGMTGMVGFDNFSKFFHLLENLLDRNKDYEARSKNKKQFIEFLFESHDLMSNFIDNVKSGTHQDLNIQIYNELRSKANNLETSAPSEYDITFFKPISEEQLSSAKVSGKYNFYKISIEIQASCVFKKVRLFIIFRALNDIGRICSSDPSPNLLEKGKLDNAFEVYFMSEESSQKIENVIDEILEIETRKVTKIPVDEFFERVKKFSQEFEKSGVFGDFEEKYFPTSQSSAISSQIIDNFDDLSKITSVKVDIETLEKLMDYFGELVILKNQISQILTQARGRQGSRLFDDMDKLFLEIQEIIFKLKLVRVGKTFRRYRRLVRDVAEETGKKITFILSGLDVEIDRKVLEELNSPIIHLLRNAIYHGIEDIKERKRMSKDPIGTLRLESFRKAGSIYIKIEDDGRGLDYEKIRQKAVKIGIYSPEEVEKLSEKELNELIFRKGFSTLKGADQISGRGMGLSIVSEKVEELGGSVELITQKDKGTQFILDVPFSRAILKAQLFQVGGDLFAIPIENIKQIYFYKRQNIDYVKGVEHYRIDSQLIPLVRVDEYLGFTNSKHSSELDLEQTNSHKKIAIWCKKDENKSVILVVDKILQQMEVVIKPFKSKYSRFRSILGVTITGDGSICMIIDVIDLVSNLSKELSQNQTVNVIK